jgi:diadenosine tetraphosphate (Ap4A) HIT family hydrolase
VLAGRYTDTYLQRADVQRGIYLAVVVWRARHVTEPTELDETEAAGYWAETLTVARALLQVYRPLKSATRLSATQPHLHAPCSPVREDRPLAALPFF